MSDPNTIRNATEHQLLTGSFPLAGTRTTSTRTRNNREKQCKTTVGTTNFKDFLMIFDRTFVPKAPQKTPKNTSIMMQRELSYAYRLRIGEQQRIYP